MRQQADRHRTERELQTGEWVYVKLQVYRQESIAKRKSLKLGPRYFGPFQIEERIGKVAYRLRLPEGARIHPVFHVSLIKWKIGMPNGSGKIPTSVNEQGQPLVQPEEVMGRRMVLRGRKLIRQLLVRWSHCGADDATWEDEEKLEAMRQNVRKNP
ncbi:hypothetical protein AXF42_Ash014550 [Apostasia shenzhenica]|uniref:Uncharacterized protein n=1 Tax=Apostasia shenzhenica TaxID=1088818 RepID=A0A2H9ZWX5_9ASPA|nr:hypothetical protein AXF42_Ash014550 [Apostasia shenzhenica]